MDKQQYAFARESRLLTPLCFSRVFENAIPAVAPELTLLARANDCGRPRLGLTIPKKRVKLAVQRNRIKRIARESFRLRAHQLPNIDVILIAKSGIATLDNQTLLTLLDKQWTKLTKRCE